MNEPVLIFGVIGFAIFWIALARFGIKMDDCTIPSPSTVAKIRAKKEKRELKGMVSDRLQTDFSYPLVINVEKFLPETRSACVAELRKNGWNAELSELAYGPALLQGHHIVLSPS